MNDDRADLNSDKKQLKSAPIKLPANDEVWVAPTPKPYVKLFDKIDRYLQQRTPHEL